MGESLVNHKLIHRHSRVEKAYKSRKLFKKENKTTSVSEFLSVVEV